MANAQRDACYCVKPREVSDTFYPHFSLPTQPQSVQSSYLIHLGKGAIYSHSLNPCALPFDCGNPVGRSELISLLFNL